MANISGRFDNENIVKTIQVDAEGLHRVFDGGEAGVTYPMMWARIDDRTGVSIYVVTDSYNIVYETSIPWDDLTFPPDSAPYYFIDIMAIFSDDPIEIIESEITTYDDGSLNFPAYFESHNIPYVFLNPGSLQVGNLPTVSVTGQGDKECLAILANVNIDDESGCLRFRQTNKNDPVRLLISYIDSDGMHLIDYGVAAWPCETLVDPNASNNALSATPQKNILEVGEDLVINLEGYANYNASSNRDICLSFEEPDTQTLGYPILSENMWYSPISGNGLYGTLYDYATFDSSTGTITIHTTDLADGPWALYVYGCEQDTNDPTKMKVLETVTVEFTIGSDAPNPGGK